VAGLCHGLNEYRPLRPPGNSGHPDAEFSLNALRSELNRLTGGSWQVDLQACGGTSDQHVGFLWNGSRVAWLQLTDAWELNGATTSPTGSACAGNLRPGRYALAKTPIGVDFHLLSVHFDSGTESRDYDHRRQAAQRLDDIMIGTTPILDLERDVLVLGDDHTRGGRTRPRSLPSRSSRSLTGSSRRGSVASP
jgi:hypothetical protein